MNILHLSLSCVPTYTFGLKLFLTSIVLGVYNILNNNNNYDGVYGDVDDDSNNNTIIKTMVIRGKTRT